MHNTMESFAVYMNLNEAFHTELIDLAMSPMLRRTYSHLTALPFAAPSAMVFARSKLPGSADMLTLGQEQHHTLLEAIEKRQGTRAEALAREHVQLSRRNLESVLRMKPSASRAGRFFNPSRPCCELTRAPFALTLQQPFSTTVSPPRPHQGKPQ